MSGKRRKRLQVFYALAAVQELEAIWDWNANSYGPDHAVAYIDFLMRRIGALERNYGQGRTVGGRDDLRYVLIRRRPKGHGHVAVYRYDDEWVSVLHIFHTAQGWQQTLSSE